LDYSFWGYFFLPLGYSNFGNNAMAKKKSNSLSDLGGFVFSTNENEKFSSFEDLTNQTLKPKDQFLEAHFSNKGRGGKTVTVISGFQGTESDLKDLGKLLKTKCGVGGSVKEGEIIIQGNYRDKIMQILNDEGYRVKRVGG
jgi:translation initiation factor 1